MQTNSLALSIFSKVVVVATLALIFLGGMVTTLGGGLSVPDWPTSFGYNMFTFPVSMWTGLVFWEHIHRLTGALVGLLTIVLAIWIWRKEHRRWMCWLGAGAVVLVIVQGVLGGLRVTDVSTRLAIVHACTAQAFLCVVTLLSLALSRQWSQKVAVAKPERLANFSHWLWVFTGVVYIQLILGAVMRHLHAGLAIPTFPLTPQGTIILAEHTPLIDIALAHRLFAVVVTAVAAYVIAKALFTMRSFWNFVLLLFCLIPFQWLLGAIIIWFLRPPVPTSLHVVNGALILMLAFATAAFATHLARANPE